MNRESSGNKLSVRERNQIATNCLQMLLQEIDNFILDKYGVPEQL
jgi:hypothetical protein